MVRTLAKSGPRIWAVLRGAPTGFLAFAEEFLVDRVRGESKMFRILVVDDDPSTAFVLREGMNDLRHRYEVDLVPDGVEALNYLYRRGLYVDAQAPDLVLLDINMPRSDGFGTLSAIKTDPELCVIPVIMLSTSGSPQDVRRSYLRLGKIARSDAIFYVVSQLIGGIVGVSLTALFLGRSLAGPSVLYAETVPGKYGTGAAFAAEAFMAALLMAVVLWTSNRPSAPGPNGQCSLRRISRPSRRLYKISSLIALDGTAGRDYRGRSVRPESSPRFRPPEP